MEGEITKGPLPRWQKKLEAAAAGQLNTSRSILSVSYNSGNDKIATKTPGKNGENKTSRTPAKTPSAAGAGGGDRFIPNRGTSNFDLGHYLVSAFAVLFLSQL